MGNAGPCVPGALLTRVQITKRCFSSGFNDLNKLTKLLGGGRWVGGCAHAPKIMHIYNFYIGSQPKVQETMKKNHDFWNSSLLAY